MARRAHSRALGRRTDDRARGRAPFAAVAGIDCGSALIDALIAVLRDAGHDRPLVTTTNDNLAALGFYQRRGFRVHAIRCGAVDEARLRKPTIPLVGFNGIELHDEIDL